MRLVLGCWDIAGAGGSQSYLLTVAGQLQELGHDVTVHTALKGGAADVGRRHGIDVARDETDLPPDCDGVVAQDTVTAAELADRYRAAARIFVVHSDLYSIDAPQVSGVASALVVMSDRVERHARALGQEHAVVRLRQPIDTRRFAPMGAVHDTLRTVLVLTNSLVGLRLELLREACDELGVECRVVGGERATDRAEHTIAEADAVVGKGRVILEAMACGRAAYVHDYAGTDGWVTPERYPDMEADAFGGLSGPRGTVDAGRFRRELLAYRPEMGLANRELAMAHHGARRHAQELVGLLRTLAPEPPPPADTLRETARLMRQRWPLEWEVHALRRRVEELQAQRPR